jgi:hypothetical protein
MTGGLRAVSRIDAADEILAAMRAAGRRVTELNPFVRALPELEWRQAESPHAQRIRAMWAGMRPVVVEAFADVPRRDVADIPQLLKEIDDRYLADAYNSLAIG